MRAQTTTTTTTTLATTLTSSPPERETGTHQFWYQIDPAQIPGSGSGNLQDPGYPTVNLTVGQGDATAREQDRITLDFVSEKTIDNLQAGQSAYVVVTLKSQTAAGAETEVAIARVDDRDCDVTNCGASYISQAYNRTLYRAFPYTKGQHYRIGLFPKDICTSFRDFNQNAFGLGCNSSQPGTVDTASGTGGSITLSVKIRAGDSAGNPIASTSPVEDTPFTLNFRSDKATIACPATAILNDIYQPGDAEITVRTELLGLAPVSGAAPGNGVYVLASEGALSFSSLAQARPAVALGGYQKVGGFINATSTDASNPASHLYNVGFMVRDAAGKIAFDSACQISGVQTSEIQGFLKKGSCFIATGAFRSYDTAPVAMLREFRDEVLLPTGAGSAFVHWYYSWSPSAAAWLMLHPGFRYPVLRALAPIEIFALGMLRAPLLVTLLALAGIALCVFTLSIRWLREARG